MSKQTKTELSSQIRHWNGILSEIDRDISMPVSLRGDALRHRLDETPRRGRVSIAAIRSLFLHKPVLSYAVMFAVMFAVIFAFRAGLGGERLAANQVTPMDAAPAMPAPAAAAAPPPMTAAGIMPETAFDIAGAAAAGESGRIGNDNGIARNDGSVFYQNGYTLTLRPGIAGIMRHDDGEVFEIDLPEMFISHDAAAEGNYLILTGISHNGGELVIKIDLNSMEIVQE
ncbi:MAG: hypothetical protein FWH00_03945 [Oscillospiraceae bacterium]|nr:hypothetical protein [Oscillospiraceae bacterium]